MLLVGLGTFLVLKTRNPEQVHVHSSNCGCSSHRHARLQSTQLLDSKPQSFKSWRTVALGFAVGLVPCPSALIALSGALTSGHWVSATLVVLTFSLGIFLSLLVVGLLLGLKGASFLQKQSFFKRYPKAALQLQSGILMFVGAWHFWLAASS
jgi:ABC-type nickel/cobalt efflux system permease component RcnA